MYLAGNAYPEIQFANHQYTRFTHAPKQIHSMVLKRIAYYYQSALLYIHHCLWCQLS